jgi:L-threonylcarbamoyladenylate synthase
MSELVSIERDGADCARVALERCIGGGGVALFPADTVYGLGCDPLNAAAIERIHAIKGRDEGKPSAIMYFSPLMMRELLGSLGERARAAVGALLPGPVTLVVANPDRRYPLAGGDDPERLGVRLIAGPLGGASVVVFQTSANRSGEAAPSRFEAIDPEIVAAVDLAIDGATLGGKPSTVVDLTALDVRGDWAILREGAVAAEEIRASIGSAS